jgi:lysophospholipase L1-like esterase
MDQFILFGDSITQQSFTPEDGRGYLGPALTDYYVRRLDIINRGFSGYNTSQALKVLPKVMPSPQQARVRFMMIFFGANDARLPDTPGGPDQHVPVEEYKANLMNIVTHACIKAHKGVRIVLVTPPPVDERKLVEADQAKYPGMGLVLRRTAKITARYAEAVRELGDELEVPVLDIWSVMVRCAATRARCTGNADGMVGNESLPGSHDAPSNPILQGLLHDGLHFSQSAYKLLFEELITLIQRKWPDQMPEQLPFVLPAWDDEEVWKDDKSGEARTML